MVGKCALALGALALAILPQLVGLYHVELATTALIAAMLASHRWRPRLLEPGIWIAMLPALAVFFWLLVWNSEHGWVHFIG